MTEADQQTAGTRAPAVSVCLPVYNDARHVEIALRSVLAQTAGDWELFIGDNASSDDIAAVVARLPDPRVRLHPFDDHVEVNANFNRTMALARGRWVLPLGADDSLRPGALADILAAAGPGAGPAAIVGRCQRVRSDGQSVDAAYYGSQRPVVAAAGTYDAAGWLAVAAAAGPYRWSIGSVAFRRDALSAAGGFREEVGLSADMDLIFRIALHGSVRLIDATLVDFMVRHDSDGNRRWAADRQAGGSDTPMSRALLSVLEAHQSARRVTPAERRAVLDGAARTYLYRAAQHRTLAGGRGRAGAVADVRRAIRLSPHALTRPMPLALASGSVLAPRWLLRRVSAIMSGPTATPDAQREVPPAAQPVRHRS